MRRSVAILLLWPLAGWAQTGRVAIVSQVSYVRAQPSSTAASCYRAEEGDTLVLLSNDDFSSYYKVAAPDNCSGYVYRNRVRLRDSDPPAWAGGAANGSGGGGGTAHPGPPRTLRACTFNIKFLGQGNNKQYGPLADLLAPYDLVFVQELVSAPIDHTFDGVLLPSTPQARTFFELMANKGFSYALSSEKTGPNDNRHNNSQSEYFVAFYNGSVLHYDADRSDFVDRPLVGNNTFDRVPWSFHFTTTDGTLDFTVTSVHLAADDNAGAQRKGELAFIAQRAAADAERDQIILGDMNIQDQAELLAALPSGYTSLNADCMATNVSSNGKPFDQVMYRANFTGHDIDGGTFEPLDLVALMKPTWDTSDGPYPGNTPFNVASYGSYYSDHKPVEFHLIYGVADDD